MPSAFIRDGRTLDGYVEGIPGQFDGFWFKFRRATQAECNEYRQNLSRKQGKEDVVDAEHLEKKLVSWELADDLGNPVDLNRQNLRDTHPLAVSQLLNHVNGFAGTDKEREQQKNSSGA